jgi:hypothetical protein
LRGQGVGPPNSRVLSAREMQTFRGFIFHGLTKAIAFDVMSEQGAEKQRHARCSRDYEKNRNRSSVDQPFPLQGGKE